MFGSYASVKIKSEPDARLKPPGSGCGGEVNGLWKRTRTHLGKNLRGGGAISERAMSVNRPKTIACEMSGNCVKPRGLSPRARTLQVYHVSHVFHFVGYESG